MIDTSEPLLAEPVVVVWLRTDLRLDDNPVLAEAAVDGRPVVVVFLLDEISAGIRPLGGASRWWLDRSLAALSDDFAGIGCRLVLRRGAAVEEIPRLLAETGAARLIFARRAGAAEERADRDVAARAAAAGVETTVLPGNLLHDPVEVATATGTPYRVFTPFWRAVRASRRPRPPVGDPSLPRRFAVSPGSERLADWRLRPSAPDWSGGLAEIWTPGETGAKERLGRFLDERLSGYATLRDRPDLDATSGLSPHLRFGEISVERVASAAVTAARIGRASDADVDKFLAELGWREFSHHLLHHFPDLATANFQPAFDAFPWGDAPALVAAWKEGRTGYPLVDAGMRQLWRTGTMHNRVRMVVASFLVKHGLVDWRIGEAWFWDTLVDACPAANPASWQWVAGSGADAAPFFRIFNPVAQGQKFDPDGAYVRRWVPEIAGLSAKTIHAPWTASLAERAAAGIRLGSDHPSPIVDHAVARARALAAFARIGRSGTVPRQPDLF